MTHCNYRDYSFPGGNIQRRAQLGVTMESYTITLSRVCGLALFSERRQGMIWGNTSHIYFAKWANRLAAISCRAHTRQTHTVAASKCLWDGVAWVAAKRGIAVIALQHWRRNIDGM